MWGKGAWANVCVPVGPGQYSSLQVLMVLESCLFFSFSCEGFFLWIFKKYYSFGFLCLEWICFEIFIVTLVFDVLPTLGDEKQTVFHFHF